MTEDLGDGYLSGLPEHQRDELTRVNAPGLATLREYLSSGLKEIQDAYDELSQQFRADLSVTSQARPLLATQS
jgi:hypothetical protein